MMRTLGWYIEKAKEKQSLKSDRALAAMLGAAPNIITYYKKNRSHPSPETMVKLAKLADVPEDIALADLGYWSNFDNAAADTYKTMANSLAKMSGYALAAGLSLGLYHIDFDDFSGTAPAVETAQKADIDTGKLYIMGNYGSL